MSNEVATQQNSTALLDQVLIKGDLSALSQADRLNYYKAVCLSAGLNPLTKPFEFITLNNKLVMYALRGCTDQLRAIHKISVVETSETEREGVIIITTKVSNAEGRTDISKGAVNIAGLKGDVLANAIMKAETKAKRRATLSICGLGLLDETEIETIPEFNKKEMQKSCFANRQEAANFHKSILANLNVAESVRQLNEAMLEVQDKLKEIDEIGSEADKSTAIDIRNRYRHLVANMKAMQNQLGDDTDMVDEPDSAEDEKPIPTGAAHVVRAQEAVKESFTTAAGKPMFRRVANGD